MNCKNCGYGLKQRCGDFEKIICTYEEGECVKITELEKENAELKAQLESERDLPAIAYMKKKNEEQLIKAKKIIEQLLLLPYANNEEVYADVTSYLDEAEQFLKGVKL